MFFGDIPPEYARLCFITFGKFVANVLCILPADRYIRRRQACLAVVPHHKTTHEESVVPVAVRKYAFEN